MSSLTPVPEARAAKVDAAVAAGDVGRAVELLKLWMRQHSYTPWVLERLGLLLLEAGFRRDAGRALFWAGVRQGDGVDAAVQSFLRSIGNDVERLPRTLPHQARVPLSDYPETVRADLERLGVTMETANRAAKPRVVHASSTGDSIFAIGCALAVIAVFVTGLVVAGRSVWDWLFG